MKFFTSQLSSLIPTMPARRNLRLLYRFVAVLVALVIAYSILFHLIMVMEGKEHSWITGMYWTLTVMSTLGFGDITFQSDAGRFFSIVVLLSGMVFLLILLPFTFIEFFYAPWVQAQAEARAPRRLSAATRGHVIITNYDPVSMSLIDRLVRYGYDYVLLVGDLQEALRLYDNGIKVVVGAVDRPETYRNVRADQAAMLAVTGTDQVNTNIAFTARELSDKVPIITTANSEDAVDILQLAGSTHVLQLPEMMGQALARRISGVDARTHVIGRFRDLLIAEATAAGTPLVGKTLAEAKLRTHTGVTVIGLWKRGKLESVTATTKIDAHSVLLLAGSEDELHAYDELFCIYHVNDAAVIIVGGGRVGRATARALKEREVDYKIIELMPERIRDPETYIQGSAADRATLERAGLHQAPAIIVSPHDDDNNVYLTIYIRRLRPDVQIISRATRERNVSTLHRAGADFVLSYASMGSNAIFNFLNRADILMVAEGLHIAETDVPSVLRGKTLAEAEIPKRTNCQVVALRRNGVVDTRPGANTLLEADARMVLVCTPDSEQRFLAEYGGEKIVYGNVDIADPAVH